MFTQIKNSLATLGICSIVIVLTSGCAVGNKHRYYDVGADFSMQGSKKLAVAGQDQRSVVMSGKKPPTFTGVMRGGYGNAFSVTTETDAPLADDLARSITAAFERSGFSAETVLALYNDDRATVMDKLKTSGAERLLLLTITNWRTDTYKNTAVEYDLKLEVFDEKGALLVEKKLEGRDALQGSLMNPPKAAKAGVPNAAKDKIEQLFSAPEVVKHLK